MYIASHNPPPPTHTHAHTHTHTHAHTHAHTQSLVNEVELARIQNYSKQTEAAFNNGDYARSTELWSQTEDVIEAVSRV